MVHDFNAHENSVMMMRTGHGNKNIQGFSENIRGFSPLSPPLAPPLGTGMMTDFFKGGGNHRGSKGLK